MLSLMKLLESLRRMMLSCKKKERELSILEHQYEISTQELEGIKTSHVKKIEDTCQVAVNEAIEAWFEEFSTSELYKQAVIYGSHCFKDEVISYYPDIDLSIYDLERN
ncbi:hypothetical protein PanWU01x14_370940 [Parasponia andersonii]|uniref:Uncharacterized protein n=1 Tax=Parasponia andersonii TaxID=3476 RepID=A0A2P5A427_PARAD|nr:hypothetical protein PanWU01x14_370940 [Parasponia andersonii]